jgi:hypothetical protein
MCSFILCQRIQGWDSRNIFATFYRMIQNIPILICGQTLNHPVVFTLEGLVAFSQRRCWRTTHCRLWSTAYPPYLKKPLWGRVLYPHSAHALCCCDRRTKINQIWGSLTVDNRGLTLWYVMVEYQRSSHSLPGLNPEDGSDTFLRNSGKLLQNYMTSQTRRSKQQNKINPVCWTSTGRCNRWSVIERKTQIVRQLVSSSV